MSYLDLRCEMKTLLNVLDVNEVGYQETTEWLIRVALFLMRTAVFIESAESGKPSFSIPEISLENHDPALLRNYQLKYKRMVTFGEFCDVRSYVEKKLGTAALNPYKSVLQLIGNEASKSDLLRGFARKLLQFKDFLSSSGFVVDYAVEYQKW